VKKTASADDRAAVLMALTAWDVVSVADKHRAKTASKSGTLHEENSIR